MLWPLLETTLASAGPEPSCLDLFCADGYYSCAISKIKPHARVVGVDLDDDNLERARLASELLGVGHIEFLQSDVRTFIADTRDEFDLVFCAGGLYHLSDPRTLLADLRRICSRFLLLQTVVSLENETSAYFKSPAPGWSHGCRFSHARLAGWLEELGWRTETTARNELPGNRRARDRGSSYFLCLAPELGAGSKP